MTVSGGDIIYAADINNVPRIIARGQRTSNSTATSGTTEQGVLRVDSISLTGGKLYRIFTGVILVDGSVANDVCRLVVRASNSGTATTASTQLGISQTVVTNTSFPEPLSVNVAYAPGSDETLSVLISIVRQTGTGVFQALAASTFPMDLFIQDCGTDPGDTGTDI